MSHYHCEIIIPPTDNIEAAIKQLMRPFDENLDHDHEDACSYRFWDFYVIGGRWAGHKSELALDQEKLKEFRQWLTDEKVMVIGVTCGKQTLADAETVVKVDAKWRATFPGHGEKCTLFSHSNDQYHEFLTGDICRIEHLPDGLTAERVIIAQKHWEDDAKLEAGYMFQGDFWNGVCHVKTSWDGNVSTALAEYRERLKTYKEEWREKNMPRDDWLAVTVDYHS